MKSCFGRFLSCGSCCQALVLHRQGVARFASSLQLARAKARTRTRRKVEWNQILNGFLEFRKLSPSGFGVNACFLLSAQVKLM
jgi:hypothetical protein